MSANPHNPMAQITGPVGIIAGGGPLALTIAEAVVKSGNTVFVCALEGLGDPALQNYPHEWVSFGSVGRIIEKFRQADCQKIVMIGHVKRPDKSKMIPDFGEMHYAKTLSKTLRGGDNQILSGIVDFFESEGFSVLGAHEVIPRNLIDEGAVGRHSHGPDNDVDITIGFKVLKVMGELDVGQATVVCGGYVLAVEAAEGTDEMLRRVAKLRKDGIVHHKGGVLVKIPKSTQDIRVDMPVIGPVTVELVAKAGLSGIIVHANCVLCHDRAALIRRADELGVFVEGAIPPAN